MIGPKNPGRSTVYRFMNTMAVHNRGPLIWPALGRQKITVEKAVDRAVRMIKAGRSRREILAHLATTAEMVSGPGAVTSILVLDESGLLRNGASPNLPADYLDAIDRLRPNALVGTCSAAAATGEIVVTLDFAADEKWKELRHLPQALGFLSAWSMPIKSLDGCVIGTFGTYFRERRGPTQAERDAIKALAPVAALAILDTHCP